jgi:hypothetical protein
VARLVEIQRVAQDLPRCLRVKAGDLLVFSATGGRVQPGQQVVEALGPFLASVLGDNDQIVSPMGAPNAVVFRARHPGHTRVDVVTGDAWTTFETTEIDLTVEP